jgi:IclR family pca regulon transcriptional regulator
MPKNLAEKAETQTDFVSSLAKGLDVLQAFSHDRPELTLSEVAEIVAITPAAARRSLLTLKTLGFVASHGRRFLLTPRGAADPGYAERLHGGRAQAIA